MTITGINGFGRFGLHLMKYWLDRANNASFSINYINDDFLTLDDVFELLSNDYAVSFSKYKIKRVGNHLRFLDASGISHDVEYTNRQKDEIPWVGKPDIFLECSGKNTVRTDAEPFLKANTKHVVISATSWTPDKTLVYGFNHEEFDKSQKIISYGSCTVNAYVPLAHFIHKNFTLQSSDVNVIHNIQRYRLEDNKTLTRKFCTLEKSATNLLEFVNEDNFIVNYTVIPYEGVSMIDFRFEIDKRIDRTDFIKFFRDSLSEGELKGLYDMIEVDTGPEVHNCTAYSTVFIEENINIKNDHIYLQGYFDNENSVNRYFDLIEFMSS